MKGRHGVEAYSRQLVNVWKSNSSTKLVALSKSAVLCWLCFSVGQLGTYILLNEEQGKPNLQSFKGHIYTIPPRVSLA